MGCVHPELLLLALPAFFAWWKLRSRERGTQIVRALIALALVLAAAQPYLRTGDAGRDLIFVVDRSRSMPSDGDAAAIELIGLAEDARREGDRVGVIAFGADTAIELAPRRDGSFSGFSGLLDRDGSDLGGALDSALALIVDERPASIVLVSDGESKGRDPLVRARRAFARGVRIDVRPTLRATDDDVAVERVDLPDEVAAGEPFQFSVWVSSRARVEREFTLEREGQVLAQGVRTFELGLNRLVFRDVLARAGVGEYVVRLAGAVDRTPENDVARAALRVGGSRPLLIVNDDGAQDTLALALKRAGIAVEVAAPESARLDRLGLAAYRAVVLENVAAERVSKAFLALRDFVTQRGGGLLVTGGTASFGLGGYHLSTIDELLPVSLEMRQEQRKLGLAMVIALDRSGSMSVPVAPGVQKMDLANLGTCAAIELLSPIDSVGVIAVDSTDHTVQELVRAQNVAAITARVRTIQSQGGGIFCYTALLAAGRMLEGAEQHNRHIVLFADAADAEEQEGCPALLERFEKMGITVSVIALGTETDSDAAFLKRVAELGGGDVYFTTDPAELPRLFAQDTLTVSRATFVEAPTPCAALPDLFGLGELPSDLAARGFPTLAGYNLTYMREDATAGVVTLDSYSAPIFAFAYRGLGRSAVYTGQIGGTHGAEVVAWDGFASFFVTLARWLAGQEEPAELFASARREGREAVVTVELDSRAPTPPDTSKLTARLSLADGQSVELPLERVADDRWEARHPLGREGVVLGTVALADGRSLQLPPLSLPYSPEFEPTRDPERGERLLREIARESAGEVAPPASALFRGPRDARAWRVVTRELVLAALCLLVLEIAARRLQLWGALAQAASPLARGARVLATRIRPVSKPIHRPAPPPESPPASPHERAPSPTAPTSIDDALERARKTARRELER